MVKTAVLFFIGAIVLVGLSSLVRRNTTSLGRIGGVKYEWRRRRRMIARVLLVAAGILAVVGATALFYASDQVDPSTYTPIIVSGVAQAPTHPYTKLPPPTEAPVRETPTKSESLAIAPPLPVENSPPLDSPTPSVSEDAGTGSDSIASHRLAQAKQLAAQKDFTGAMGKVSAAIAADPKLEAAYSMRATFYVQDKRYDDAAKDYTTILKLNPKNAEVAYNLAQISFIQDKFDNARPGFAALQQDPTMGDLAAYKVFLCDLFGGHEAAASKELDAFNDVGSNASYYFANLAWSLYHKKLDDAADWEKSARAIYSPEKFNLYAESLMNLSKAIAVHGAPTVAH
jgi:Tfp pilus assembly protein PilF